MNKNVYEAHEASTVASTLVDRATDEIHFDPIKHNIRHSLVTPIIVVDDVNKYSRKDESYYDSYWEREIKRHSGLLFKKVGQLDFWNEISGWFHANTRCTIPHPVYDTTDGEVEIPSDVPVRNTWDGVLGSLTSPIVAGAYLVDKDYNLYRVYGWTNDSDRDTIFIDFV